MRGQLSIAEASGPCGANAGDACPAFDTRVAVACPAARAVFPLDRAARATGCARAAEAHGDRLVRNGGLATCVAFRQVDQRRGFEAAVIDLRARAMVAAAHSRVAAAALGSPRAGSAASPAGLRGAAPSHRALARSR